MKLSVGICIHIDSCRTGASDTAVRECGKGCHCTGARVRREVRGRVWNIACSVVSVWNIACSAVSVRSIACSVVSVWNIACSVVSVWDIACECVGHCL